MRWLWMPAVLNLQDLILNQPGTFSVYASRFEIENRLPINLQTGCMVAERKIEQLSAASLFAQVRFGVQKS